MKESEKGNPSNKENKSYRNYKGLSIRKIAIETKMLLTGFISHQNRI